MIKRINFFIVLCLSSLLFPCISVSAGEPNRPDVKKYFDFEKETKINEVMNLKSQQSFEKLRDIEFLMNDDFLHKTIFKAFDHRRADGINLAINCLKLPDTSATGARVSGKVSNFYIAKKILEVFPDDSIPRLLNLYKTGNAITRGNIVKASGMIAGGQSIRMLLINALEDKAFSDPEDPELDGPPLRVCDVAYNQLVLRYRIKNVLRTIGTGLSTETRDYHINILKQKL
jgi:hypothetical protein